MAAPYHPSMVEKAARAVRGLTVERAGLEAIESMAAQEASRSSMDP
jgi:hypothetical protein